MRCWVQIYGNKYYMMSGKRCVWFSSDSDMIQRVSAYREFLFMCSMQESFFFYPNTINATGGWALLLRLDLSFILFLAQAGFLCCCLTVSLLELCETTSTWSLWPWFLYKYDCSYCICVTITIFHIVQFFFFSSVSHWKLIKTFSLAHSPQMISFGNNIKTFPF